MMNTLNNTNTDNHTHCIHNPITHIRDEDDSMLPYCRPSIYNVEHIEHKYATFVEKMEFLPTLETIPIYFDITPITRHYIQHHIDHEQRYMKLRDTQYEKYQEERIAHGIFVQRLNQLALFRAFVTDFLRYAINHMPIHVDYFTSFDTSLLVALRQEEALHQQKLMTLFHRHTHALPIIYSIYTSHSEQSHRSHMIEPWWSHYMNSFHGETTYHAWCAFRRLLSVIQKCIQLTLDSTNHTTLKTVPVDLGNTSRYATIEYSKLEEYTDLLSRWIATMTEVFGVYDNVRMNRSSSCRSFSP